MWFSLLIWKTNHNSNWLFAKWIRTFYRICDDLLLQPLLVAIFKSVDCWMRLLRWDRVNLVADLVDNDGIRANDDNKIILQSAIYSCCFKTISFSRFGLDVLREGKNECAKNAWVFSRLRLGPCQWVFSRSPLERRKILEHTLSAKEEAILSSSFLSN